ncbi:hypothetical protein ALC56_02502, partial [Trachymyrmex septentrionalis]
DNEGRSVSSFGRKGGSSRAGSMVSEGGLSCREINILKKWVSNNEKEERRKNIIIKRTDMLRGIEIDEKERGKWIKGFIKINKWIKEQKGERKNIKVGLKLMFGKERMNIVSVYGEQGGKNLDIKMEKIKEKSTEDLISRERDLQRQWERERIDRSRYNKRYKEISTENKVPNYLRVENMEWKREKENEIRAYLKDKRTYNKDLIVFEFIKNWENSVRKLQIPFQKAFRNSGAHIINLFSFSYSYFNKQVNNILIKLKNKMRQFLKNNQNLIITKADKGNMSVALNKDMYIKKMNKMLNDENIYVTILKDSTKKMISSLKSLITKNSDAMMALPYAYGLPKVYKVDCPLRIITSLSSVLTDLMMQDLKSEVLSAFDFHIPLFRYVNDIVMAVPSKRIYNVSHTFNNFYPRLQFTFEIGGINFLDSIKTIKKNVLQFDWYQKPTYSGRILNFWSQHPISQKRGVISGLVDKAFLLSHRDFHGKNLIERIDHKISFFSINKLNRFIKVHKNLPQMEKKNIIYKIECKDCNASYVGQIHKNLKIKIKQHNNYIRDEIILGKLPITSVHSGKQARRA